MSYSYKNVVTRTSITLQIIEDIAIYKAELFSTAGNIFQPNETSTDITVSVFKGLVDITDTFTNIKWRRFTFDSNNILEDIEWSKQHNGKKTITVKREDVEQKVKIQCEVYDTFKDEETLVAVESITIIDVNDLSASTVPPTNPTHGQLWLDSSIDPPLIKMWDSIKKQWIVLNSANPQVRNLLRNSNFFTKNFNLWDIVNSADIMAVRNYISTAWAHLRFDKGGPDYKGISQTVLAKQNLDYVLQVKAMQENNDPIYTGGLTMTVYSIDSNNIKTLVKEDTCVLTEQAQIFYIKFKSLEDTVKLEVQFTGEKYKPFNFMFTETMLASCTVLTPWEIAPEDVMDAINGKLNHEDIFNALTDNGKIEGIFTQKDNLGNTHFYFNASYIKTGTLKGNLIDARNLVVKNINDTETLRIDEYGNVYINAASLSITGGVVATTDDIPYQSEIVSTNGNVFNNNTFYTYLIAKVFKGGREFDRVDLYDYLPNQSTMIENTIIFNKEDDSYYKLVASSWVKIPTPSKDNEHSIFNYKWSKLDNKDQEDATFTRFGKIIKISSTEIFDINTYVVTIED